MFGRNKPPAPPTQLADRMRRAVERPVSLTPSKPQMRLPRADRQAVYRQGMLVFADGERLAVAIKNLSKSGARVEFFIRRELPELVVLIEPTLRIKHRARVVWQRDGAAGLAFEIGGAG